MRVDIIAPVLGVHHPVSYHSIVDERGALVALEGALLPFPVKRIFYMYDVKSSRGFHAHKNLEEILICMSGSCCVSIDDGKRRQKYRLDRRDQGVYIGPGLWIELSDFSRDTTLMVLASEVYEPKDSIEDYDIFLKWVSANGD